MSQPKLDQESAEKSPPSVLYKIQAFDLPPLEEGTEAYVSLEASILQHGCIHPIVVRGDVVLSGNSRKKICEKHKIKYEVIEANDLSEADRVSLQDDLNFVGRHIDTLTKKEYAKHLLLCYEGKLSNRAIGSKACLDKKIVQGIREELEASGDIPHTKIRYSRDGRSQDITDKEERQSETDESGPGPQDESDAEASFDIEECEVERDEESPGDEELDDWLEDDYPHLLCFDGPSPEELPKHVYEVNKDKATIVRRKVDRQEGEKYILSNGQSLPKCFGHPIWLEAHDSLLAAVQGDQEETEDDIENLGDQRKELLAELKNIEAQIVTATKEKRKLELRLKKVEDMVPPKGAAAETEDEAA